MKKNLIFILLISTLNLFTAEAPKYKKDTRTGNITCLICNYKCLNDSGYSSHIRSNFHASNILKKSNIQSNKKLQQEYVCKSCEFFCYSENEFLAHFKTLEHKRVMELINQLEQEEQQEPYVCQLCEFSCHTKKEYFTHFKSSEHKRVMEIIERK